MYDRTYFSEQSKIDQSSFSVPPLCLLSVFFFPSLSFCICLRVSEKRKNEIARDNEGMETYISLGFLNLFHIFICGGGEGALYCSHIDNNWSKEYSNRFFHANAITDAYNRQCNVPICAWCIKTLWVRNIPPV